MAQALEAYASGCTWSYFIPNIENVTFNMQHSYSTSWLPYQTNVRTRLYNSKGKRVLSTESGLPLVNLRLGDLLDYSGISKEGIQAPDSFDIRR